MRKRTWGFVLLAAPFVAVLTILPFLIEIPIKAMLMFLGFVFVAGSCIAAGVHFLYEDNA